MANSKQYDMAMIALDRFCSSLSALTILCIMASCQNQLKLKVVANMPACSGVSCVTVDTADGVRTVSGAKTLRLVHAVDPSDQAMIGKTKVDLEGDLNTPIITVPEGAQGQVKIFNADGSLKEALPIFVLPDENHPLITADPNRVCSSDQFYNADGILSRGKKDCGGSTNSTDKAAPAPSYCKQNGEIGCIATERFKALDYTELAASQIKKGVTVAGTTGTLQASVVPRKCSSNGDQNCYVSDNYVASPRCAEYGSSCYVPAYVSGKQALKAVSYDAIARGRDSFRGSLGGVNGTIVDCTDGSSGCYVSGPNLKASALSGGSDKILAGKSVGGISGNVSLPGANKVLAGTKYGVNGSGLTGTLTLPAASNVSTGNGSYGDPNALMTPNLVLPSSSKVLSGTLFGVNGSGSTGALTLPTANHVIAGSGSYGDPLDPITPTLSSVGMQVRPPAPAVTGLTYDFAPDRINLSWQSVNGAVGYLVLMHVGSPVTAVPADYSAYSPGVFASDTIVYAGSNTSVTHNTVLAPGKYYFAIYSYQANQVYSALPTEKTLISCTGLAGGTWVPVPGDSVQGTSEFCAMKYIASKDNSNLPSSEPSASPWTSLTQLDAVAACFSLGSHYHLMTNPEWLTIAVDIAQQGVNWSGGIVGSGTLSRGNADSGSSGCQADPDDTYQYLTAGCARSNTGSFLNKRTFALSTGKLIWDMSGNNHQMVDYHVAGGGCAVGCWREYSSFSSCGNTNSPRRDYIPTSSEYPWWNDAWNTVQSIGMICGSGGPTAQASMMRAGPYEASKDGLFRAHLTDWPTGAHPLIAFRCSWQP